MIEEIVQILPNSSTDDGIFWSDLLTPILRIEIVRRLLKLFQMFILQNKQLEKSPNYKEVSREGKY